MTHNVNSTVDLESNNSDRGWTEEEFLGKRENSRDLILALGIWNNLRTQQRQSIKKLQVECPEKNQNNTELNITKQNNKCTQKETIMVHYRLGA